MRLRIGGLLLPTLALSAWPLQAQPGPGPGPGPRGAEFFLARTGELRLTDAQVVRLAAIARRSADRRRTMRAAIDSAAGPAGRGMRQDSAARVARAQAFERMRARVERERELGRADLRDALAVLTAEQQALAWEMVAGGRPAARGALGRRFRGDGFGRGERARRARPQRRGPPGDGQRPPQ